MAKNLFHRIAAISLASLMLLFSTGFSMDVHYCQDQLKGVSFIGKAKSCHERQEKPSCHKTKMVCHTQNDSITNNAQDNCCHNEKLVIKKAEVNATSPQLVSEKNIQFDFVFAFVVVFIQQYIVQMQVQPYEHYKPPLPDRDVLILYQTFLI